MEVGFEVTGEVTDRATVKPGDAFNDDCPGRHVLNHVTSRWGVLILSALSAGPLRFYMLRDRIGGISEKMLSQNLRILVRDGLIQRKVEPAAPPRVSYALTPLGAGLALRTQGVVDWITLHANDITEAQRQYDSAVGDAGP
ncbi:helix-turn-helix transcriptional regulator [Streptomyces sp. NBC_01390]|uniref:winged helix-turn-helix transcriptional regulator n=1 Tax=Streptomyces sp. NBC_01390 TaxID=2903850 RepID=UPI00324FC6D7